MKTILSVHTDASNSQGSFGISNAPNDSNASYDNNTPTISDSPPVNNTSSGDNAPCALVMLNSSLTEELFGKTKFSNLLSENGFIVAQDENGDFSQFSAWSFTGTKTIDDEVFFTGEGFLGCPIASMPENGFSNDDVRDAIFAVCQAYTFALQQNIHLPCSGPSSVIYSTGKLLFVPQKTFNSSCANLGKNEADVILEPWRDSALTGSAAMCFSRAVYAYFALTKTLPYPPDSREDKSVAIAYKKFMPLELCVNGVDSLLSVYVDTGLSAKDTGRDFPIDALKNEMFFPEKRANRKKRLSDEDFKKAGELFKKRQEKKIQRKMAFNRWHGSVILVAAAFVIVFVVLFFIRVETGKKPTVVGLNSTETVKVFYQGIHKMDTDLMLAAAKSCPQAQGYISRVPQIFVSTQLRGAYNFDSGMSTPENWMFFEPDSTKSYSHTVYGLTNFMIDGAPSTLNETVPTVRKHKSPVRIENGERLSDISKAEHTVTYFLVHTVDMNLVIETVETTVFLRYSGDRWQIVELKESLLEAEVISPLPFSLDYKDALSRTPGDEISAIHSLREKYNWLPTEQSLVEEESRLDAIGY